MFARKTGSFEWCPARVARILFRIGLVAALRPVRISHQCRRAVALFRLKRLLQVSFVMDKSDEQRDVEEHKNPSVG